MVRKYFSRDSFKIEHELVIMFVIELSFLNMLSMRGFMQLCVQFYFGWDFLLVLNERRFLKNYHASGQKINSNYMFQMKNVSSLKLYFVCAFVLKREHWWTTSARRPIKTCSDKSHLLDPHFSLESHHAFFFCLIRPPTYFFYLYVFICLCVHVYVYLYLCT